MNGKALRSIPLKGFYNGFSMYERCKVIPVQRDLARQGAIKVPETCSICGFLDPGGAGKASKIVWHLEDYRSPDLIYPLCRSCHYRLHTRFQYPERWLRRIDEHHRAGAWFTMLTMDGKAMFRPFDETYSLGLPAATD
jgi:hypothetical protein